MKNINKFMLYIALFMAGSAIESQQNQPAKQDSIELNIINAMQECIKFNDLARIQLFAMKTVNYLTGNTDIIHDADAEIKRQGNLWSKAIKLIDESISNLREKHGSIKSAIPLQNLKTNPNTNRIEQLMIQMNEYKNAFSNLLNEYIVHLGQLYEKKSGLLGGYRTNYYLSSRNDQSMAITPHEYPLLLQTLDDAAKQSNWGNEIDLDLLLRQENGRTSSKNLKLNEIIYAIRQVPLPTDFYTTAAQIGAGVAAAAAVGAGAYYVYNANHSQPQNIPTVQEPVISDQSQVPLAETSILSTIASNAYEGAFGSKPRTVEYWQGGGDAELYGAPGLSGEEFLDSANLLMTGQLVGNVAKYGAVQAGTKLGLVGPKAPNFTMVGQGVETNAGQAAKEAFLANKNKILTLPAPAPKIISNPNIPTGPLSPTQLTSLTTGLNPSEQAILQSEILKRSQKPLLLAAKNPKPVPPVTYRSPQEAANARALRTAAEKAAA